MKLYIASKDMQAPHQKGSNASTEGKTDHLSDGAQAIYEINNPVRVIGLSIKLFYDSALTLISLHISLPPFAFR